MTRPVEADILQKNRDTNGSLLTPQEREDLLRPYLPPPRDDAPATGITAPLRPRASAYPSKQRKAAFNRWRRPHLRTLFAHAVHLLLFHTIHFFFTLYIYTRQLYHALYAQLFAVLYYHHRSPELIQKDIRALSRLPKHLSIIVDLKSDVDVEADGKPPEGLERLIKDVSEVSAWCMCAGIEMLSVYERTGILKQHITYLQSTLAATLHTYYPISSAPTFTLRAPHMPVSNPPTPLPASTHKTPGETPSSQPNHLAVLLLSAQDGRSTLLDLTKTLTEMAQRGKLSPSDISPELIDAEVTESSCGDPDLLLVMTASGGASSPVSRRGVRGLSRVENKGMVRGNGDGEGHRHGQRSHGGGGGMEYANGYKETTVNSVPAGRAIGLQGYPPWQVRLTEICYSSDCRGVAYQDWLRGLCRYAKAEMRFGR